MYAIKVNNTNRFIEWCSNCWYGTTNEEMHLFTKEQADEIAEQLKDHYVYSVTLIDEDGNEELKSAFAKPAIVEIDNENCDFFDFSF